MLRFLQWLVAQEWLLRLLKPAFGPFDPFSRQFRRDPHPTWRKLREQYPMYSNRLLGAFLITRYDDCVKLLRDPNFTTDRSHTTLMKYVSKMIGDDPEFRDMVTRNLLMIDGDQHRMLRGLVSKAFTPRRIEQLRPRVQGIVDELLDEMEKSEDVELVRDLARPLPLRVIMELLGLPKRDTDRLLAWSAPLVQLVDPLQARGGFTHMRAAVMEMNAYLRPLLEERRAEPRDDLLSALMAVEQDGVTLQEPELLALVTLLLVAGHETTTNLVANGILALLRNPREHKRLRDEPELITSAVDEFLRWDGPIQVTDRAALEDCEVAGRHIRRGQLVMVSLGGANRDPARFADPDRLDLSRADNHHLAFGMGNHFCLGAQLAKLEAEIAIGSLVRRFPNFTGPTEPDAYRRSLMVRGPVSLPLCLAGE